MADGQGGISYLFDSQVLRYDLATGNGRVVAGGLTPFAAGYVSLLGVGFGPDGLLYTSDFAGGIRSFNAGSGSLVQSIEVSGLLGDGAIIVGNFAFGTDGALYASIFRDSDPSIAGIAQCDIAFGQCNLLADGTGTLLRPIGFAVTPVPEPATALLMALGGGLLWAGARRRA